MQQPTLKIIGKYSYYLSQCLGQGSFGKVFEGFENTTKEKVAIKKIDFKMFQKDSYLEQSIYSEIKILNKFKHPNVVQLYEVLNSKRSLYIVTEYCKHGDLKKYLKTKGRLSEDEAFQILKQITCGFKELMREKVIHRDLKPANILIHNGVYKLCDFGFSKFVDNVQDTLKSCVGSPIYMAPQILEKQKYTFKCDIWSLGIIYYQMLFGSVPWKGMSELDLLKNIKSQPLKLPGISEKVQKCIRGLLSYQEGSRLNWDEVFQYFQLDKNVSPGLQKQHSYESFEKQPSLMQQRNPNQSFNTTTTTNNFFSNNNNNNGVPVRSNFLNRYQLQQIAFRHYVCVDIKGKLHRLKRYNYSKYAFERFLLLICGSIKAKMQAWQSDVERIHQSDVVALVKAQFSNYKMFFQDLCGELARLYVLEEISRDYQYKRLLDTAITDSDSKDRYQGLFKSFSNTILQQMLEQIKASEHPNDKDMMLAVADNIVDMLLANQALTRTSQVSFERVFREKGDEALETGRLFNKVVNKLASFQKGKVQTAFFR